MRDPNIVWRERNLRQRLLSALPKLAALAVFIAVVVFGVIFLLGGGATVPSRASMVEEPVRATTAAGDRVYIMTSQWRTFRTGNTRTGTSYTNLLVDVWAFDPATVTPIWRKRIADDRGGQNMGRKILGVQGDILWLLDGRGLVGLSPTDGSTVAGPLSFESANPALRGVMPTEDSYFHFDPQGLWFTAADGRDYRLTGQGSATRAAGPRLDIDAQRADPVPGVFIPANQAGGISSWAFYTRGLKVQGGWFGLMAEAEVPEFRKNGAIGGVDPANHPRVRMWSAKDARVSGPFGPMHGYSDFKPLPEGPEFLQAGLLQDNRCCRNLPILLYKPDSFLVLHKARLGDDVPFKLTRVSGPLGKPLWDIELPVTGIEAVMPGAANVVMVGRRDEKPLFGRERRPESVDHLVSVDYATGRISVYGFRIPATAPDDLPKSSTTLDRDPG